MAYTRRQKSRRPWRSGWRTKGDVSNGREFTSLVVSRELQEENRAFVDSYIVYKRRVDVLIQVTETQVSVMPIGGIKPSTLM
ncbi:hypothetical protein GN244_ATG00086 [Phytophthora infestans]|uniref:Uncharacterized protein n=1 Tax=Phytophthora infestans TaxID=4787 RepID=A0A833TNA4_PHYIN|nr:hypothetical protein GN244_ATG00086 [Phytophthora infestans]